MKKQKPKKSQFESFLKHVKNITEKKQGVLQNMNNTESSYLYLKQNLIRLSEPFEEQYKNIEEFARWNLASDIASDWENCEPCIECLYNAGLINDHINSLFKELLQNFDEHSYNGMKFDPSIWNEKGMETHPFWQEQRLRAKELLNELNKIDLN